MHLPKSFPILLSIPDPIFLAQAPITTNEPLILPQGHGPFRSSLRIAELVDKSRLDPYNKTHTRRLMVSVFSPVPVSECAKTVLVPYMPPVVANFESDFMHRHGYPEGMWSRFQLEVCASGPSKEERLQKYPLALFSPGLQTTRHFYSSLALEIASYGFTVVTIDHPYDTDVVAFPDGTVIHGGLVVTPGNSNGSTASVEKALAVRAKDASFVLDTFGVRDVESAVMFGHSFGGAAAANALHSDQRLKGGINLDGPIWGPARSTGLNNTSQAFLIFGSEGHNTTSYPGWVEFWAALEKDGGWKRELKIKESGHGSYWDVNILVDIAKIRDNLDEVAQSLIGPVLGERVWKVMGRYLPSFLNYALGRRVEDEIFNVPSKEYPEVEILRK